MMFLLSPFGRVSRRGFWLGYVALFAALLTGAYFADGYITRDGPLRLPDWAEPFQFAFEWIGGPVMAVVLLFLPWTTAMMVIKRLHDRGFGGLLLVWKLVALAGLLWVSFNPQQFVSGPAAMALHVVTALIAALMVLRVAIIVAFLPGQEGDNAYGPDPLVG